MFDFSKSKWILSLRGIGGEKMCSVILGQKSLDKNFKTKIVLF